MLAPLHVDRDLTLRPRRVEDCAVPVGPHVGRRLRGVVAYPHDFLISRNSERDPRPVDVVPPQQVVGNYRALRGAQPRPPWPAGTFHRAAGTTPVRGFAPAPRHYRSAEGASGKSAGRSGMWARRSAPHENSQQKSQPRLASRVDANLPLSSCTATQKLFTRGLWWQRSSGHRRADA